MAHNHTHTHASTRTLKIVFFLNFFSAILEFIIGFLINSQAISADALHDLGDSLILGTTLVLTIIAYKPPTEKYTFGYKKLLLINVILNTLILLGGSLYIIYSAFNSLDSTVPVLSVPMIIIALVGFTVNIIAFKLLHSHSDINSKTVSLHLLEDVLGWAAVLVGGIIIYYTNWYIVDKLLAIAISIIVIYNSGKNLYKALQLLLLKSPVNSQQILAKIQANIKGKITDFHLWSPDGEHLIASLHVKVPENITVEEQVKLKKCIREIFKEQTNNDELHLTIEIDFPQEELNEHHHCKNERSFFLSEK